MLPDASIAPPTGVTSSGGPRESGAAGLLTVFFLAALVVALLLLRQPYRGVRHDGVLYIGQTLVRLDPSWAAADFFFKFGSQDKFSLFSTLFAWPLSTFGVNAAEMLILTIGHLGSLLAIWWMLDTWSAQRRWLVLVCVACLPHFYGGREFGLFEPFVTARTLAEPLALLALGACVRGRNIVCLVALLAAFLAHPLIALPAAVTIWLTLIGEDRRWLLCALVAMPVAGLALRHVAPFSALFQTYDDYWFGVVSTDDQVFVSEWQPQEWTSMALELGLLWLATRSLSTPIARLSRVACVATVALCALSFFAADLVHDVLLTQVQLWRVNWILHILAVCWLPGFVLRYWRNGGTGRLAALAICCAMLAAYGWLQFGWALVVWAGATIAITDRNVVLERRVLVLAGAATLLVLVAVNLRLAWDLAFQISMHRRGAALSHMASIPFSLALLTIPAAVALMRLWARRGARRIASGVVVAVLLVGSVFQFDQRSAWTRYVESAHGGSRPFETLIAKDKTVFWEETDLVPIWLLLGRASFAGEGQFSGLLFDRRTAMEATLRAPLIAPIQIQGQKCQRLEGLTLGGALFDDCETPEADFFRICTAPRAHADFLVTHLPYSRKPAATWVFDPKDGTPPVTYYLHDCSQVH